MIAKTKSVVKDAYERLEVVEWLQNVGMVVPAARLRDCGEGGRGWWGYCPDGHEIYHAFGCKERICARCSHARSCMLQEKLAPAVINLLNKSPQRFSLKHITLGTDVNILDYMAVTSDRKLDAARLDALREKVMMLRGCVAALFREYTLSGAEYVSVDGKKDRVPFSGMVEGFAIGCEFGAKAGTLHFHVLALMDYVDVFQMSKDWERLNHKHGSYAFVREVKAGADEIIKSIGYVTKYVTKPMGARDNDGLGVITENVARMAFWCDLWGVESVVAALAYVFKGMRRFQTYGAFFALEFEDEEPHVCSVCGQSFHWVRELDALLNPPDFLKTLKRNNFCVLDGVPPDCVVQNLLF